MEPTKVFLLLALIACTTPLENCSYSAKIWRSVLLNGFHRELETKVVFQTNLSLSGQCKFILEENFTRNLFLDKYQLAELSRFHYNVKKDSQFVDIKLLQEMDLEKPEYMINETHSIFFQLKEIDSSSGKEIEFTTKFPFHIRYQKPSQGKEYTEFSINHPKAFLYCGNKDELNKELERKKIDSNVIIQLPSICTVFKTEEPIIQVPTGQINDIWIVSTVTFSFTLAAVVIIAYLLYCSKTHKD